MGDARVPAGLAGTQERDRAVRAALGPLGAGDDEGAAAGAGADDLQQMQRIDDHARVEHIGSGDLLAAEESRRVFAGILALIDRDFGQLLGRGAEFVHMPPGDKGIAGIRRDQTIGGIELGFNTGERGRPVRHSLAVPGVTKDTQHVLAHPRLDGSRGPPHHPRSRGAPQFDLVKIFGLQMQIVGYYRRPQDAVVADGHASEEAVDVFLFQASVSDGVPGDLADNAKRALAPGPFLRDHLGEPDDRGFSFDAHNASLILWRRRPRLQGSEPARGRHHQH